MIKQRKKTKTFHQKHFENNAGNSKEIWRIINKITSRNIKTRNSIHSMKKDTEILFDPSEIEGRKKKEELSRLLRNILRSLGRASLPSFQHSEYLKQCPFTFKLSLRLVTKTADQTLLDELATNKAIGLDSISSQLF